MSFEQLFLCLWIFPALTLIIHVSRLWVIAPLKVWIKYTIPAKREWLPGWPDHFAPAVRSVFTTLHDPLTRLGFEHRAVMQSPTNSMKTAYNGGIYVHPQTHEIAVLMDTSVEAFHTPQVTVLSDFCDGSSLETTLGPSASFAPPDPLRRSVNVDWIKDVSLLRSFHQSRIRLHQLDALERKRLPIGGEILFIESQMSAELSRLQDIGYLKWTRRRQVYRFTLFGAVMATRNLREPYRGRLARRRERAAREEWQTAGMADAPAAITVLTTLKHYEAGEQVQYSAVTEQGQFTIHRQPNRVTITMGGRTLRRHLGESSGLLLWPTLTMLILLPTIIRSTPLGIAELITSMRFEVRVNPYTFAFYAIAFSFGLFRMLRTFPQRRGPFELIVTPDELSYRDSGVSPTSGRTSASEIQGVRVVRYGRALLRSEYVLCIFYHSGRPVLLMRTTRSDALLTVQNAVAVGLGLEAHNLSTVGA